MVYKIFYIIKQEQRSLNRAFLFFYKYNFNKNEIFCVKLALFVNTIVKLLYNNWVWV